MINSSEYRSGVGILLFNKEGLVFVGDRIDEKEESWQLPQGGVDPEEDLHTALFRETMEEIGTNNFRIIKKTEEWLYYDLPPHVSCNFWGGKYKGQRQVWFLCEFLGLDSEININNHGVPEFSSWKWVDRNKIVELSVDFKKELYSKILSEFNSYF
jgi:putative (di)nucleoside polyphosphate hydrolase